MPKNRAAPPARPSSPSLSARASRDGSPGVGILPFMLFLRSGGCSRFVKDLPLSFLCKPMLTRYKPSPHNQSNSVSIISGLTVNHMVGMPAMDLEMRNSAKVGMHQKRILVPTDGPETWKRFLAEPEKQWKLGFSAMSTACSWEQVDGLPPEIAALFESAAETALRDAKLTLAIPEYKVALAGGSRPSQNDVFAVLSCSNGLITMMVEGKAREDFGPLVGDWAKNTSSQGVRARLGHIMQSIGLGQPPPDDVRYQLLHRSASAVIEAKRFHAPFAAVVIQSFEARDTENHYGDFCNFVRLFGITPAKGILLELSQPCGCRLFAAWVQSVPVGTNPNITTGVAE